MYCWRNTTRPAVWSGRKRGGGSSDDYATGVLAANNGFIYVVGGTASFGAGWYDALILKFDSNGNFIWARTWGGGSFEIGHDLSFDPNGNLLIAAETYSFGTATVLLKFSTDGSFLGSHTWKGPSTYDGAYSITVDGNGNTILTGISWDYSVFPNHNTILVLKYDNQGNLLWSRTWAGPSEDEAWGNKAVRTDAQGNIYIAGRTSASCTNPNFSLCDFDVLLLKIDPNGNLAWAQKWGGTGWDTASGLVVDSENKLIVVGSTASFFGGLRSALIQKYDTTGAGPLVSRVLATSAASGWAGLVAGPSGVLVATGDGPNSGGTWQDTGISAVPALGSLSSPPYSVGAPTGTTGIPPGSTGDPTSLGVRDTGGGGSDVLTAAFSFTGPVVVASSDFDGDGLADKAIFRPATGTWYVKKSNGSGDLSVQWGTSGDVPVAGNYAGDTRADFAVFRPSDGTWYVRSAEGVSQPPVQWGALGDVPVPGQYGGDSRIDFAVWRPSNGTWYVQTAEATLLPSVQWGTAGDIPVPGDYDGDGVTDMAVFRPSTGTWYVRFSGGGTAAIVWGASGDIPVAADFTGDGRADYGIFRPSTGTWYVKSSASLTELPSVAWGASGDVPLPAQMAGDSRADDVVWRPSNGSWYVRSAEGLFPPSVPWGTSGDIPLAR